MGRHSFQIPHSLGPGSRPRNHLLHCRAGRCVRSDARFVPRLCSPI
jgi:hypothetical protein